MVGAVRLLSACSTVSRGIPTNLALWGCSYASMGRGVCLRSPCREQEESQCREGCSPISVAPWEGGSFHTQLWFQPQLQLWSRALPEPSIGRVEDGEAKRASGEGQPLAPTAKWGLIKPDCPGKELTGAWT